MKKYNTLFATVAILVIVVGAAGWWLSRDILEWEKPDITLTPSLNVIGLQKSVTIGYSDRKSGLSRISAALWQDNRRYPLFDYAIAQKDVKEKTIKTEISPRDLKLHDGEAILQFTATDHSLLKNTRSLVLKTSIDLMPPQITLLSAAHNINPGGTCLTVYALSKEAALTGVRVDADTFKAYPATVGGKKCFICFFAIPSDVTNATRMSIYAEDKGGNKASASIPYYIRNVKPFRSDAVNLGDNFLDQKMPEFQQHEPKLRGKTALETFVSVNGKLREDNFQMIQNICSKTDPKQLWEGIFLRMKNASPMAMFGDKRTYIYQKNAIGVSTHMGVDLASTQNAPVEAANNGTVLYTGYLGIYGNTIIVDHGVGICSHYSHLNSIDVKVGQKVAKGNKIGNSGITGLAGGDHLHYGMMVGHKFVNPVEWWDPHWLQDNVDKKLKGDFSDSSPASASETKSLPPKHKKTGKKRSRK